MSRGEILRSVAAALLEQRDDVAGVVARETGKSLANARGETEAAASLGFFYAGEGQRLYGRTTTSGVANRFAMTVRQPVGVAGLIIAANTPIANVAWKVFPALICGNCRRSQIGRGYPGRPPRCSGGSRRRQDCRMACSISSTDTGPRRARPWLPIPTSA